jgi:hypothetical protein
MRHQWLHRPRGWQEVPGLEPVLRRDLDLDLVHAEPDDWYALPLPSTTAGLVLIVGSSDVQILIVTEVRENGVSARRPERRRER